MAIWMNAKTGDQYDDGLTAKPGEAGFTRDKADVWAAGKGYAAKDVNYVGTPNWVAPTDPGAPAA